jgi:hypothetical protein
VADIPAAAGTDTASKAAASPPLSLSIEEALSPSVHRLSKNVQ